MLATLALLLVSAPPAAAQDQDDSGICDRSAPARDAIMAVLTSGDSYASRVVSSDCSNVTAELLSGWLTYLTIDGSDYPGVAIAEGDLDGLTGTLHLTVKNFDTMTALPSVSGMTNLGTLTVTGNPKLTSLPDLSKNARLEGLTAEDNDLTSLPDLSKNAKLDRLWVGDNRLTSLPALSAALEWVKAENNDLTSLPDLSALTALEVLNVNDNDLTSLPDLSKNTALIELWANDNSLTSLPDLSKNVKLEELWALSNNLTSLPNLSALTALRELKVGGNNLTSLPDLSALTALEYLNANDMSLTALPDLSKNTALDWLLVRRNRLTALPDLSKNTALRYLSVRGNRLTELTDLNENTELIGLWVYDNRLTALPDLSKNTKLKYLHAYNNRIYPLPDLSANTNLQETRLEGQTPASFGIAPAGPANEGANAQLTLTLSENASSALEFSVDVTYGSGAGAADAADLGDLPTTVQVPSGGNDVTFQIPVATDDAADEGDETFTVSVSTDTAGWKPQTAPVSAQREPATTTVTIKDIAQPETLRFKKTRVKVVEGEKGEIRITRSGDTSRAIEVTLTYTDGSATFPDDYKSAQRNVSFPSGKRFRDIPLPIVNDNVDEDNETFTLSLSSDAEGYVMGEPATITIKDDDTAGVKVSTTTLSVNETGRKTYEISLASKPTADVVITATSGDPEKATVDSAATSTLTFTPENWKKKQKITIRASLVGDDNVSVTHVATSADPKYHNLAVEPVSVTIEALETPSVVTNLQVSAVVDNSVTVTWDRPEVGEELQRYTAWLEPQGDAKGKMAGEFKRPYHPKRSVVFRDLLPGVTYKIHVWVRNSKPGPEAKSDRVSSEAFTVPAAPPGG